MNVGCQSLFSKKKGLRGKGENEWERERGEKK
jgi:hypothetical protein